LNETVSFRRRPAERGPEILAAAKRLFAERGFEATRIVDIARHAGVSHGTVGLYYPSKEALLFAVVDSLAVPQIEAAQVALSDERMSGAEQLEALGRFWMGCLVDQEMQQVMRVTEAAIGVYPAFAVAFRDRILEPAMELFRAVIRRGIARGEFECDDIESYIHLLFAGLDHVGEWNASIGNLLDWRLDPDAFLQVWLRAGLAGLKPVS
jgi:TetR/AcrR family transcriptional regulator